VWTESATLRVATISAEVSDAVLIRDLKVPQETRYSSGTLWVDISRLRRLTFPWAGGGGGGGEVGR